MEKSSELGPSQILQEATEVSTEQGTLFGEDVARGEKNLEGENSTDNKELGATSHSSGCYFCGASAEADDPTSYEEVTSWVRGKKKDSSVLRVYTGRRACKECIDKLRVGIAPDQVGVVEALDAAGAFRTGEYDLITDRSAAYLNGFSAGRNGEAFIEKYHLLSDEYRDYREGYDEGQSQREAQDFLGGAAR